MLDLDETLVHGVEYGQAADVSLEIPMGNGEIYRVPFWITTLKIDRTQHQARVDVRLIPPQQNL